MWLCPSATKQVAQNAGKISNGHHTTQLDRKSLSNFSHEFVRKLGKKMSVSTVRIIVTVFIQNKNKMC